MRNNTYNATSSSTGKPDAPIDDGRAFRDAILSRDVDRILEWVMPDIEIFVDGQVNAFRGAARQQLTDPESSIARLLLGEGRSVRAFFEKESGEGEVSLRVYEKAPPGWVIKFPEGQLIREIVFASYAGKWRVWEIAFR